jgi:hypothetical protein
MTDEELGKLTNDWYPAMPQAFEKSVALGGGKVLFPCHDPASTAAILQEYVADIARRAFQAGRKAGKQEIRDAIFK